MQDGGIILQQVFDQRTGTNIHVRLDITVNETEFVAGLDRQNHLYGTINIG